MIVDCHTHIWESVDQLGRGAGLWSIRGRGRSAASPPHASIRDHLAACEPVAQTIVLGFKSYYLDAEVPNDYVAQYVRAHPERLLGFAGIDPARPQEAIEELRRAKEELGMVGATIWPAAQDVHPASSAAMRVYSEASRLGLPILIHQDVRASEDSKMEFSRPYLVDEIAREFPDLKIVISQMGYPWMEETVALLAKHGNVFADISGLIHQGWIAYNALLSAYQTGVMEGLLFGSDFPHRTAASCIEALYSINQFCYGTSLPTIPREQLRQIVERDVLRLLGINNEPDDAPPKPDHRVIQVED